MTVYAAGNGAARSATHTLVLRGEEPWLLDQLMVALLERMPVILDEIGALLRVQHPGCAEFFAEQRLTEVSATATAVAGWSLRLAEQRVSAVLPPMPEREVRAGFDQLGREHARRGGQVLSLLARSRNAGTVVWRHLSAAANAKKMPAPAFGALAAAVFAAVDQFSMTPQRGHRDQGPDAAAAHRHARDELAALLLSPRGDIDTARVGAHRAGWALPRRAAVVLIDPDDPIAADLLDRPCHPYLRFRHADLAGAIVADPDGPGRRARLAAVLAGAVVGDGGGAGSARAQAAARPRDTPGLTEDPLFVDEHLDALLVHRDETLLTGLRRYVAPLAGKSAPSRDHLTATLAAWPASKGNHRQMAAELCIHPQSVRYRLARLRALHGSALQDPAFRAGLLLALAWGPRDRCPRSARGAAACAPVATRGRWTGTDPTPASSTAGLTTAGPPSRGPIGAGPRTGRCDVSTPTRCSDAAPAAVR